MPTGLISALVLLLAVTLVYAVRARARHVPRCERIIRGMPTVWVHPKVLIEPVLDAVEEIRDLGLPIGIVRKVARGFDTQLPGIHIQMSVFVPPAGMNGGELSNYGISEDNKVAIITVWGSYDSSTILRELARVYGFLDFDGPAGHVMHRDPDQRGLDVQGMRVR
jgi:hypothetical protein